MSVKHSTSALLCSKKEKIFNHVLYRKYIFLTVMHFCTPALPSAIYQIVQSPPWDATLDTVAVGLGKRAVSSLPLYRFSDILAPAIPDSALLPLKER